MGFMDQVVITGPVQSILFDTAAGGDIIIVPAVPGKRIAIYRLMMTMTGAQNLTFKDGAGTPLTGVMDFAALANVFLDPTSLPWFETSPGNAFIITAAATRIAGKVDYIVER